MQTYLRNLAINFCNPGLLFFSTWSILPGDLEFGALITQNGDLSSVPLLFGVCQPRMVIIDSLALTK